jgi:cell division septation protein DedD
MAPSREEPLLVTPTPVAAPVVTTPGGLFVKTASDQPASPSDMDLTTLLNLPPVSRRTGEPAASRRMVGPRVTSRRSTPRGVWWRRALDSLSLPALGMGVMLFAGGIAVSSVGKGPLRAEEPPLPPSPLVSPPLYARPVVVSPSGQATNPIVAAATTPAVAPSAEHPWVVQVAAFASAARSTMLVQQLTSEGWPAFQVDEGSNARGLTVVNIGPYRTAAEADSVIDRLRATPDYDGAFVRNIGSEATPRTGGHVAPPR